MPDESLGQPAGSGAVLGGTAPTLNPADATDTQRTASSGAIGLVNEEALGWTLATAHRQYRVNPDGSVTTIFGGSNEAQDQHFGTEPAHRNIYLRYTGAVDSNGARFTSDTFVSFGGRSISVGGLGYPVGIDILVEIWMMPGTDIPDTWHDEGTLLGTYLANTGIDAATSEVPIALIVPHPFWVPTGDITIFVVSDADMSTDAVVFLHRPGNTPIIEFTASSVVSLRGSGAWPTVSADLT